MAGYLLPQGIMPFGKTIAKAKVLPGSGETCIGLLDMTHNGKIQGGCRPAEADGPLLENISLHGHHQLGGCCNNGRGLDLRDFRNS